MPLAISTIGLKTLFDALRVPDVAPPGDTPQKGEALFLCLLDSDALITEVQVTTDRLLEPRVDPNVVEMVIAAELRSSAVGIPLATYYEW